jgi:hypothetical protein
MEEGPEDAVGEPLVIAGDLIGAQGNGYEAHVRELPVQLQALSGSQLLGHPGPPDPEATRLLVGTKEPSGHAASASLYLDPALRDLYRDWQAIGHNEDAVHDLRYRGPGTRDQGPGTKKQEFMAPSP